MIDIVFVLFLFLGGEMIEYTPKEGLSDCLSTKRKIERNVGRSSDFDKRWVCKKAKVQLEKGYDGEFFIESFIDD